MVRRCCGLQPRPANERLKLRRNDHREQCLEYRIVGRIKSAGCDADGQTELLRSRGEDRAVVRRRPAENFSARAIALLRNPAGQQAPGAVDVRNPYPDFQPIRSTPTISRLSRRQVNRRWFPKVVVTVL